MPAPRRKHPVRLSVPAFRPTPAAAPTPPPTLPLTQLFLLRASAFASLSASTTFPERTAVVQDFRLIVSQTASFINLVSRPLSSPSDAAQRTALGLDDPLALSQIHYLHATALHILATLLPAIKREAPGASVALAAGEELTRQFMHAAIEAFAAAREAREEGEGMEKAADVWDAMLYAAFARASCEDARRKVEEPEVVQIIAVIVSQVLLTRAMEGLKVVEDKADGERMFGVTLGGIREMVSRAVEEFALLEKEVEQVGSDFAHTLYAETTARWLGELEAGTTARRVGITGDALGKLGLADGAAQVGSGEVKEDLSSAQDVD